MLSEKTVVIGVSSSIAVYKAVNVVRSLKKLGADVHVIMTVNATKLMSPVIFENLSGNRCSVDTFDRNFQWDVMHIALAKKADYLVIAPATANVISKIASGICDDMLTTTVSAMPCGKMIVPAMNTVMYENPIIQGNIEKLKSLGYRFLEPETGMLANGDIGKGRFPGEDLIVEAIVGEVAFEKDLAGKNVLVSAGATVEAIDPVRFISNRSTGKMGYEVARAAWHRGANVTLVLGENRLSIPKLGGMDIVQVSTAQQMQSAMEARFDDANITVMAAAVADYRPAKRSEQKIKKQGQSMELALIPNADILLGLGKRKRADQKLCGFAMETENLLDNARQKLEAKNLDMIVANDLTTEGAGFAVDTNVVTIITPSNAELLEKQTKSAIAHILLDRLK